MSSADRAVHEDWRLEDCIRVAIEFIVLAIVAMSPWPQGSYEAVSRFWISIGLALALLLWAVRLCLMRHWVTRGSGPLYCLAGIVLLSSLQYFKFSPDTLAHLSPASAELYAYYLPVQPEVLEGHPFAIPADHPISISPGDTRDYIVNGLALCVLYCIVINNVVSHDAFLRFAWVCALNGTAVSLLAFAQRLSSSDHLIYWSIVVGGSAYGPFDYRNVFPYFANVCIGLTFGLLAANAQKRHRFLQNTQSIWLFTFVIVMLTAVVFSMSRGGLIALVVALAFGGIVWLRTGSSRSSLGLLLWTLPAFLLAVSWIGWSALETRYQALADTEATRAGRYDVWRDSLPLAARFALFGSGNGTFEYVEPMNRQAAGSEWRSYPHAHNEYVEAVVEGGVTRLLLTVALIATVTFTAMQNFHRQEGRTLGWLILGGLVGFWALALQSVVDFGIHYPAIAILGVVLMAHIVAVRQTSRSADRTRLPFVACLIIGFGLAALGVLFVWEGYTEDRGARFYNAAILERGSKQPDATARRVQYMETAVRYRPSNRTYRDALSMAYLAYSRATDDATEAKDRLLESLRQAAETRNLCPLLVRPHLELGLYRDRFASGDPPERYFERALRSFPTNPAIWYTSGKQHFNAGEWDKAWVDWRRSLEMSPDRFADIERDARTRLSIAEFLDKVIPDKAESIYFAAEKLFPDAAASEIERKPFLEKAVTNLQRSPGRTARDDLLLGKLLGQLHRHTESIAALQQALAKDPNLLDCHWELAHEFCEQEMFQEARREMEWIYLRDPRDVNAKDLLDQIKREIIIQPPPGG